LARFRRAAGSTQSCPAPAGAGARNPVDPCRLAGSVRRDLCGLRPRQAEGPRTDDTNKRSHAACPLVDWRLAGGVPRPISPSAQDSQGCFPVRLLADRGRLPVRRRRLPARMGN